MPFVREETERKFASKIVKVLIALLVAAIPAIIAQTLLHIFFKKSFFDFFPFHDDEMVYWLSSLTYSHVGFQGGYFSIDEVKPPLSFIHYGAHGPLMPMTYAIIASLWGEWKPYSGVLVNLFLCTSSLLIFIGVTKPGRVQILFLSLLLICFWPLIVMIPVNMQEGLHLTIGILLAACFFLILSPARSGQKHVKWVTLILLSYAACVRPSWSVLYFPAVFLCWPPQGKLSVLIRTFTVFAFIMLAFTVFKVLGAPYPHQLIYFIKVLTGQASVNEFIQYAADNIKRYFATGLDPVGFPQRMEILFIIVVSSLILLFNCFSRRMCLTAAENKPWLLHITNLALVVLCTISLYCIGDYRDFRVWSGPLLLSLLLMIALSGRFALGIVAAVILANLFFAPQYLEFFRGVRSISYNPDRTQIDEFKKAIEGKLVYNKGANPWCNTLLAMNSPFVFYHMASITPGIGVSDLYYNKDVKLPYQSKYILLDRNQPIGLERTENVRVLKIGDQSQLYAGTEKLANLRQLVDTRIGTLWLNLDANCL